MLFEVRAERGVHVRGERRDHLRHLRRRGPVRPRGEPGASGGVLASVTVFKGAAFLKLFLRVF